MDLGGAGRLLLVAGLVLAGAGAVVMLAAAAGLGRLPGDLTFRRGNLRVYVPLATSILVSVVLTVILNVALRR